MEVVDVVVELGQLLMGLWELAPLLTTGLVWSWMLFASIIWVIWSYCYFWLSRTEFGPREQRRFPFLLFKLPIIVMRFVWWPVSLFYYGRDIRKWLVVQFQD